MSDLIERLRDGLPGEMEGRGLSVVDYNDAETLFTEAAAELTALRSQVSRLTADLEVAVGALEAVEQHSKSSFSGVGGDQSERASLRGAIRKVKRALNTIRKDG